MNALKEIGIKKAVKFAFYEPIRILLKFLPYPPVRTILLKVFGVKVGKDSVINDATFFNLYRRGFGGLSIGDCCFIGHECMLDLADEIKLGDHVTLAERVTVLTHLNVGYKSHPLQKQYPPLSKKVVFKEGCFVGANSTILAGVTVGKASFVAAGSVVVEDVPDNVLVGGVPAKVIKKLV